MFQNVLDYLYEGLYSTRILAGCYIFAHFLMKRRFRNLAFIILTFIAVVGISSLFNPVIKYVISELKWDYSVMTVIHGFWYSCLLFVLFGILIANYKGSAEEYIYCFTCGLLVECSVFGLFRLFYDFGVVELRVNTVFSVLLEFFFSAAIYIAAFFLFRYIYGKSGRLNIKNKRPLMVYFILIVILIMFLRLNLQGVYEIVYKQSYGWIISLTLGLIPLALLALVTGSVHLERLSNEKQILAGMLSEREKQYRVSSENIEIINRKCHDIRRSIRALKFADKNEIDKVIKETENSVNIYDAQLQTDNAALNTLISEKLLYCNANGIKLTCNVQTDALKMISPVDVYVLFGNIIDNAIEAVRENDNPDKRVISMTVYEKAGMLCLRSDNYFSGERNFVNGIPMTTKTEEQGYHGFGIKSIKYIVEKYGGRVEIEIRDDIYIILATIPVI